MDVEYLGHAGFVVTCDGASVLIDPWFHPAFLGSWFPAPDNRFLLEELRDRTFDALFVSHVHEDHLDRTFLAGLARSTPVLCADFRSRSLHRAFKQLGFTDVRLLGHGESLALTQSFTATMVLDTSHREDSGLLLEGDGSRFLDLNDCLVKLGDLPTGIDVLTRQYSGASWYPNCYRYPEDVMATKVATGRRNLLSTLETVCATTGARWFLPSAGPPVFLDPALSDIGPRDATIFPLWADVEATFTYDLPDVGIVEILPGDVVQIVGGTPSLVEGPLHGRSATDAPAVDPRAGECVRSPRAEDHVTTADLHDHLARRLRKNPGVLDDRRRVLHFGTESDDWTVTIDDGELSVEAAVPGAPCDYSFVMPSWVLREAIERNDWEDIFLSMRVRLHRDPDDYDVRLMSFLRYGGQPVVVQQLLADMASSDETVDLGDLRLQRYCPHSGEDLTHAIVHGDVVECPRHHWKWNIETGECIEGGTLPLRIERRPA